MSTARTAWRRTRPGKPKIDWDDPQARDALVSALVNDATRLVEIFTDPKLELTGEQAEAVALLALVAGQDVEPTKRSDGTDGRWRIARRVAADRVISTVVDGFTLDDFTVNETAGTVTCPHNVTRLISPKRAVTFGATDPDLRTAYTPHRPQVERAIAWIATKGGRRQAEPGGKNDHVVDP